MALEVKKREKETPQSLIYRFAKAIQKSGILIEARERMFRVKKLSEEKKKRTALRREELKKYYQELEKLGKLK